MNMEQAAELETLRADVTLLRESVAKMFEINPSDLDEIRRLKAVLEAVAQEDRTGNAAPALGLIKALLHSYR